MKDRKIYRLLLFNQIGRFVCVFFFLNQNFDWNDLDFCNGNNILMVLILYQLYYNSINFRLER